MKNINTVGKRTAAWLSFAVFSFSFNAAAMPAAPLAATSYQANGTAINVHLKGDEHGSWFETESGYSIEKNKENQWVYVVPATGAKGANNTADSLLVGAVDPELLNLPKHITPENIGLADEGHNHTSAKAATSGNPIPAKRGAYPLLVILGFYDNSLTAADCLACATTDPAYFRDSVFSRTGRSVTHFFNSASNGRVDVTPILEQQGTPNDGIVGWIRLGATMPEAKVLSTSLYKSNQVAADAINAAMNHVDFTVYDADSNGVITSNELGILIVVAGYEGSYGRNADGVSLADDKTSPLFWGQSRSFSPGFSGVTVPTQTANGRTVSINTRAPGMTYSIIGELHGDHPATLGIMAHELGHSVFALPDLYDVTGKSMGVGVWSLMGYGSWGQSYTDGEAGQTPVLPDAWTRVSLGWVEPVIPEIASLQTVLAADQFDADVIKIPSAQNNEYFLIENRQNSGYDAGLVRLLQTTLFGGLAVWHVDDSVGTVGMNNDNSNAQHKRVDLVAAVGDELLDKGQGYGNKNNLFFEGNSVKLDTGTTPSTKLYSGSNSEFAMWNVSYPSSTMSLQVNLHSVDTTLASSVTSGQSSGPSESGGGGGGGASVALMVLAAMGLLRKSRQVFN